MRNSTTLEDVSAVAIYDPVSDHELQIITIVNICTIRGLISLFGTVCNIINIIIFVKMGLKDTTNISLLGIAVADTGSLVPLLWGSICLNPLMIQRFEDLEMSDIHYLTSAWPHNYFVQVTGWLTALVTIERYLCIAYPLKVGSLVTRKRIIVVNVTVFAIVVADVVPTFMSRSLGRKVSLSKNRTVIGIKYISDSGPIEEILLYYSSISKLGSFLTVVIMTIMLVHKLNDNNKWRQSTLTTSKTGNISARDLKVVRMVAFISAVFILCYFPLVVLFVAMKCEKEFSVTGKYKNLFSAVGIFMFLLEAVNSSVNIFVYLRMSSKYRETFVSLFSRVYK